MEAGAGASAERRPAARAFALAALAYAALSVLFTWPATLELGSSIFGGPIDGPMFLWNTWWAPHAAFELHTDPLFTEQIFHPVGTSLVVNSHCVVPALASWPLQRAFGLVPAYNVMVLLTFVLSGLGTWLLVDEIARDRRAAFIAGLVFAFGCMRVSKVMFFNLIQTQMLVFWAWALWRAWRRRSLAASIAAGAIGALTFWVDYDLAVFAGLWGLAFGIYALVDVRSVGGTRGRLLAHWAAMAVVLVAGAAPLLLRLRGELAAEGDFLTSEDSPATFEATPLRRLFVPDAWLAGPNDSAVPVRQSSFLGYATLALAAFGLWTSRRERMTKLLIAVAALFLVLALGPELNLGAASRPSEDQAFRLPLPFAWVLEIPVLKDVRSAHRFGIVAWIAIAIAAGLGMRAWLARLDARAAAKGTSRTFGCAATALAAAGVMLDFTRLPFPARFTLPPVPPPIEWIAEDPRDCCVLEFQAGRLGDGAYPWFDTIHGKPVHLDGQTARLAPKLQRRRAESPLRRLVARCTEVELPTEAEMSVLADAARAEIRRDRIGWIVVSQLDWFLLNDKRELWSAARLLEIDARLRAALPSAERVYLADAPTLDAFAAARNARRPSIGGVFAAYKLRLP